MTCGSPFKTVFNMQEYLYQLASTMRQIAAHVDDDHLFSLEQIVRYRIHVITSLVITP